MGTQPRALLAIICLHSSDAMSIDEVSAAEVHLISPSETHGGPPCPSHTLPSLHLSGTITVPTTLQPLENLKGAGCLSGKSHNLERPARSRAVECFRRPMRRSSPMETKLEFMNCCLRTLIARLTRANAALSDTMNVRRWERLEYLIHDHPKYHISERKAQFLPGELRRGRANSHSTTCTRQRDI